MSILYRGETIDKHVVHAFETVVIEWAHQIQDVLKQKSDQQLVQGLHPDPMVELEFWKDRCANMEYIYEQVSRLRNLMTNCYIVSSVSFRHFLLTFQTLHN